jgi:hypothetical protein
LEAACETLSYGTKEFDAAKTLNYFSTRTYKSHARMGKFDQ